MLTVCTLKVVYPTSVPLNVTNRCGCIMILSQQIMCSEPQL